MVTSALMTLPVVQYDSLKRQINYLTAERDAATERAFAALRERDAAQDVIEAVRAIALKQSSTLWSKKILAALAQQLVT